MSNYQKPLITMQILLIIGILYSPFMFIQTKDYFYGEILHGLLFIYFASCIYYFKGKISNAKLKNLTLTILLNLAVPILSYCIAFNIIPAQHDLHPVQLALIYYIRSIIIYLSYTFSFLYLHQDLVKELYVINGAKTENKILDFLQVNEKIGRFDFFLKSYGSLFLFFLTTLLYLSFADLTNNLILLVIPYTFGLVFFICFIRNTLARLDDLNWSRAWFFLIIFPAVFFILLSLLSVTPGKDYPN